MKDSEKEAGKMERINEKKYEAENLRELDVENITNRGGCIIYNVGKREKLILY